MCRNYIWKSEIKNSLNYVISLLFIGIEIQLQEQSIQIIQCLSLAIIFVAIIYRILSILQNNTWKTDLSPMFLWLLTLARIATAKSFDHQSQLFICYILGFVNGQFNNSLTMGEHSSFTRGKVGVQLIVIVVLLIIDNSEQLSIILLQIALTILIGFNELRWKEESTITPKLDSLQKSNKLLNEPSLQKILKNNSKNSNDDQFVKHSRQQPLDSVEEYDQVPDSGERLQIQQNESQNKILNWSSLVEQCEDYICRFTINAHQSSESQLQHSYNNYSFSKFLQDNSMSFLHFIKDMKVYNDLNMIHYDLTSSEFQKLQSLYDWLHFHLEQYKLVEQIQIRKSLRSLKSLKSLHSDQLQLSNPSNQKSLFMDLIVEKSIMGLSSIPYQQGSSSEALNMKNSKINLFGRIKGLKSTYDLNIKLYLFHEVMYNYIQECESGSQLNIIFMMRDIDILVGSLKQNLKNVEVLNSATKFIQNQVCKIQGIHRVIKDAKNLFNESDYASTRMGTQVPRRTYSLGQSNKDSVEEVKSDISEKFGAKKQNQLHLFIQKLQYDFIQVEQDNFNFFEVFTTLDKIWFEKKKIDLSQLITNIFELFQNDSLVMKCEIKLILNDQYLHDKCMITDTRRLKQLLINLINNSVKAYDYEQYQLAPNAIELSVSNHYDDVNFQLVDYGCGIIQADLNAARLQEGKLGLAACQRLVYQLSNCKKNLTIKRTEQYTSVQFSLPRILLPEKIQLTNEFQYENIQLINS